MTSNEYPGVEIVPGEYDPLLMQAVLERLARRLSDRVVSVEAHAASHQHGGDDEVAVAEPAANAIVKALGTALVDAGWLPPMVGDSGEGGTKGAVPAPAAGDAAGGRFLKADGTWAAPPGAGGGEANTSSNSGGGQGLALAKVGDDLPFKSLTAGAGVVFSPTATELDIALSADTDDVANASNVPGTTATDALEFNNVLAGMGV